MKEFFEYGFLRMGVNIISVCIFKENCLYYLHGLNDVAINVSLLEVNHSFILLNICILLTFNYKWFLYIHQKQNAWNYFCHFFKMFCCFCFWEYFPTPSLCSVTSCQSVSWGSKRRATIDSSIPIISTSWRWLMQEGGGCFICSKRNFLRTWEIFSYHRILKGLELCWQ